MANGGYNWGSFAGHLIASFTGGSGGARTIVASGANRSGTSSNIFGGNTVQHAGIGSGGYVGSESATYIALGMIAGASLFAAWYVWG